MIAQAWMASYFDAARAVLNNVVSALPGYVKLM